MNRKCGVYKLISKNRIYIGSSVNISRRVYEHYYDLRYNKHSNRLMQQDYDKGISFTLEILEECSSDVLKEREQYWIDYLGGIDSSNLYNLFSTDMKKRSYEAKDNKGCNNPMYGKHHSIETRQLISQKSRKIMTIQIRNQISKKLKGHYDSLETRNKKRQSHLGKHHSQETIEKIRKNNRGKSHPKGINTWFKGRKRINNGIINKFVLPEEIDIYLNQGWKLGEIQK